MIFVSVGTQLPFDRMVQSIDEWAAENPGVEIVGQIGRGAYVPKHFKYEAFIGPEPYKELQDRATLFVSHAGMGGILGAMELGKPLIIMPRLAVHGEHRNDHQLATVSHFRGKKGIYVADNEVELKQLLSQRQTLMGSSQISSSASPELVDALSRYISDPRNRTRA